MKKITILILFTSLLLCTRFGFSQNVGDPDMPFTVVEVMPKFPGGEMELAKFLKKNIAYPKEAKKLKIEGRVYVRFVVDREGNILYPKVMRGIGYGCDEEAIRVIRMMPKWIPGTQGGQKVSVTHNLPIDFKLK